MNKGSCSGAPLDGRLRVLSWNIHDSADKVLGSKLTDETFKNTISKSEIFCLQETKKSVKIPGYKCYNSLRENSRSGGICIGVKHEIKSYITPLKTAGLSKDIMAIKISRKVLNLPLDVVLVNIYDSPETSSYKKKLIEAGEYEESLENLDNFISICKRNCHVMICGDLNARTSKANSICGPEEEVMRELESGKFLTSDTTSHQAPRSSMDTVLNLRGKKLLDMATSQNLAILNGSIIGDAQGQFTCATYNGLSVVDYFLASYDLIPSIKSLQVQDFSDISDHTPIMCTLNAPYISLIIKNFKCLPTTRTEPGFKWIKENNDSKAKFIAGQKEPHTKIKLEKICSSSCMEHKDVSQINTSLIQAIQEVASATLVKRNPKKKNSTNKNVWFDQECRKCKRKTNKLAKRYYKHPSQENKTDFFQKKKAYRALLKQKKRRFFAKISRKINEANKVNWESFKKLKSYHKPHNDMDIEDLASFYNFFKDLYSRKSLPDESIKNLQSVLNTPSVQIKSLHETLDYVITMSELENCLNNLKHGKAVAEDGISNEFLINSTKLLRQSILKVFNECLRHGLYPWNVALITPIHKKGDKYNPDNYRAIAVGSNLGKLFSSILLNRLLIFRNMYCPDPISQLGFCKNAQTSDHIFVLNTCIQKYTAANNRLYTCFIDFQKAFDTVCREALLYKLFTLGIQGNFFKCLQYMYSNSKAKIKLINKFSESIDVLTGTEQGHPMSP